MLVREGGSCERQKSYYGRDAAKDQRPDWRVSTRFVCMKRRLARCVGRHEDSL
jgi:hypothetical protein